MEKIIETLRSDLAGAKIALEQAWESNRERDARIAALEAQLAALSPAPAAQHTDDKAVDRFAAAMKRKLAQKREEGRGGWDDPEQCSAQYLSNLLRDHVEKGDPLDVGNLAMMLHQRGDRISPAQEAQQEPDPFRAAAPEMLAALKAGIEMRRAQASYFKDRTRENLIASKDAEKRFDDLAKYAIAKAEGRGNG